MSPTFKVGAVLHWKGFEFDDGSSADKFFVLIGAKQGCNWLLVIATSRQKRKSTNPGCDPAQGYYHIPGGGRDFFRKDTWLMLMECREVQPAIFMKQSIFGNITVTGELRPEVVEAIRNCLRECDDVPELQLDLL